MIGIFCFTPEHIMPSPLFIKIPNYFLECLNLFFRCHSTVISQSYWCWKGTYFCDIIPPICTFNSLSSGEPSMSGLKMKFRPRFMIKKDFLAMSHIEAQNFGGNECTDLADLQAFLKPS